MLTPTWTCWSSNLSSMIRLPKPFGSAALSTVSGFRSMCWSSASKTHNAVRPCGELSSSGRSVKDGFWLTPEELEEAGRLLRAARSDLRAAQALAADAEQENDVVGVHPQHTGGGKKKKKALHP